MKITILGCGNSTGVPLIQCECPVCQSKNEKNKRLRASVWIQKNGKSLLVDTSTDLRQQALRANIQRIDAVLYTHPHADHTHGIDELRGYNYLQKGPIPAFGNAWTCKELRQKFPYIFTPTRIEGGGIPQIDLTEFDASVASIHVAGIPIVPLPVAHGTKECVGYRIDSVAYVTDCSYIPQQTLEKMRGISVLILDCLRIEKHQTHFNLEQALEIVSKLKPKSTFLTHLGHQLEYEQISSQLPSGVNLAFDGLVIEEG